MQPPTNDMKSDDHRGTSSPKGGRGISNRGVPRRAPPERNVEFGAVDPVVEGRLYRAKGLDIGDPGFSKRGVDLSQVVDAYNKAPGSQIVITGSQSPSVQSGKRDADLPRRRAEAAKEALVKRGIPPSAIRTDVSPPFKADPRDVWPDTKASMRGATFEVIPPKRVSYTPKGFTDNIYYVKEKPKPAAEWIWPPPLRPWHKDFLFRRDDDGGGGGKEKDERERPRGNRRKRRSSRPFLLQAAGVGVALFLLPELLEAALAVYGKNALMEKLEEKLRDSLREGGDKRLRKHGILRVDVGRYDFPEDVLKLVENKYQNANILILANGPGQFSRSIKERFRLQFLKQWAADHGVSLEQARKDFEGFEIDESLSLQLGGVPQIENQEIQYGRVNNALGRAEVEALRRSGLKLGDEIRFIWLTTLEKPDPKYSASVYDWYAPRIGVVK